MAKADVAKSVAKKVIKDSRFREAKKDNDTVRLWENYREQALLWRAIALLQMPGTLIALVFAVIMWVNREVTLTVPAKPLPGLYLANEINDEEFLSAATEWVNLIATYQPKVARKQFVRAAEYLVEPMLSVFETKMMDQELKAIENTMRTQIYYVDPVATEVTRDDSGDYVIVTLLGERLKIVAGEQLPVKITQFRITMTTVPRQALNPHGIVITNVETSSRDK